MKKIFFITSLILTMIACQTSAPALQPISSVNQTESVDFSNKNNVLLDVRTPGEYEEGHIPQAINVDFLADDFEEEIEKLDKNKNYYVYCKSGNRSTKAIQKMEEAGFENLVNLKDGYSAYKE